jgi:hypothetical protein
MFVKDWTEAHEREALRALFRLADELMASESPMEEAHARNACTAACSTEEEFRPVVRRSFHPARVDQEVRRVDALATGRLVRKAPNYGVTFRSRTSRKSCREAVEAATGRPWWSTVSWSRDEAHAIAKRVPGSVVVLRKAIRRKATG